MAATLTEANQNSNSPYQRVESRFTAVMTAIRMPPSSHAGSATQACSSVAPAMASTGTTISQKYQYSQPATNPAGAPRPTRVKSVKLRTSGRPVAISAIMRITSRISTPAIV